MFAKRSSTYNSLVPRPIDIRIIISACQVPSIHVGCILQLQVHRINEEFCVQSLLGLPMHETAIVMPFSVYSTIIVTNVLITRQEVIT